jgi:hypothetical protein
VIQKLKKEIPMLLCKMETFFPPGDETFFARSSSSESRRSQLLSHVEAEGLSQ